MLELPSRRALTALAESANAVLPTAAIGFTHHLDDGRVQVLYLSTHGIGAHVLPAADVPEAMRPGTPGATQVDPELLAARPDFATEWQLGFYGIRRLISAPVPGLSPPTRFWAGRSDAEPPSATEVAGIEALAGSAARILGESVSDADRLERLQRLDLAAALLPTLLHVLDVREVFTRRRRSRRCRRR